MTEATEEPADVALAATAGGIRFANHTDRPVYYTAFEREYAARVLFAPCTDAERCPAVAPGAQVTIPLSLVGGYEPGKREALVYWWHLTTGHAGGRIVEDMHSEVVRLPPSVP